MKRIIATTLFFILFGNCSIAQISFSIIQQDVKCNNLEFGKIDINVVSTNPPYTFLWNTGQATSSLLGLNEGSYSVVVTDNLGIDTTITISIHTTECQMSPEIVFTPNGDGINDSWFIQNSQFFPQTSVTVYNRLGQKVFEHRGVYEPWDGKDLFGVTVPDASYYYIIFQNGTDKGSVIKGCISIIK
jgi:gliding motility-associated-like protein